MSHLISGKLDRNVSPWLSGAPITALYKKSGGVRPIAVGDVLRRLASRLCCYAMKSRLPAVFLPYIWPSWCGNTRRFGGWCSSYTILHRLKK